MPTRVKRHEARRGRTVYQVKTYVRKGPEHSARWKRMVAAIRKNLGRRSSSYSPEAIATFNLGMASYTKAEQRKIMAERRHMPTHRRG